MTTVDLTQYADLLEYVSQECAALRSINSHLHEQRSR